MKIKNLYIVGLLSLSLMAGCSGKLTQENTATLEGDPNLTLEMLDEKMIDLDGDEEVDRIKVYNAGTELEGKLHLGINDQFIVLEDGFYPPNDKMYEVDVDYLNFDNQINILINLRQYANGVGSNSFVRIFEFKNDEIKLVWDYSEIEQANLVSTKDGKQLKLVTGRGLEVDIDLDNIPTKIAGYMDGIEIPEHVKHSISSPVTSRLIRQNGDYKIEVVYMVRKPLFITNLVEVFNVNPSGVEFIKDELKLY